jgi:hypothetical protein
MIIKSPMKLVEIARLNVSGVPEYLFSVITPSADVTVVYV